MNSGKRLAIFTAAAFILFSGAAIAAERLVIGEMITNTS